MRPLCEIGLHVVCIRRPAHVNSTATREVKGVETMRTRERDRRAPVFELCVRLSKRVNRPGLPPLL